LVESNVPVGPSPESVEVAVVPVVPEVKSNASLVVVVVGSEVAPNASLDVVVGSEDVVAVVVGLNSPVTLPTLSAREEVIEPRSEVMPPRMFPSGPEVEEVV